MTLTIRVTKLESEVENSRGLIAAQQDEIKSLRESRHEHSGMLLTHKMSLSGLEKTVEKISSSLDRLTDSVDNITLKANKVFWMICGGVTVGSGIVTFLYFIGKEVLHVW